MMFLACIIAREKLTKELRRKYTATTTKERIRRSRNMAASVKLKALRNISSETFFFSSPVKSFECVRSSAVLWNILYNGKHFLELMEKGKV